jgi:two-component system, NarL family, nitrate/nitrite response regulator NarL
MKILIADDHPLYREALRTQLERQFPDAVVDEVTSLDDARHLGRTGGPHRLFMLDFNMPGMSVKALSEFAAAFPAVPIAVISGMATAADVRAVIQAGAKGFIPKTASGTQLVHALQLVVAGGTSVPAEYAFAQETAAGEAESATVSRVQEAPFASLTVRELEVLKGVARGLSNKEIARELKLAEVTVKLHLRSVFRKIGARSRSEAAVIATKANI